VTRILCKSRTLNTREHDRRNYIISETIFDGLTFATVEMNGASQLPIHFPHRFNRTLICLWTT